MGTLFLLRFWLNAKNTPFYVFSINTKGVDIHENDFGWWEDLENAMPLICYLPIE